MLMLAEESVSVPATQIMRLLEVHLPIFLIGVVHLASLVLLFTSCSFLHRIRKVLLRIRLRLSLVRLVLLLNW